MRVNSSPSTCGSHTIATSEVGERREEGEEVNAERRVHPRFGEEGRCAREAESRAVGERAQRASLTLA